MGPRTPAWRDLPGYTKGMKRLAAMLLALTPASSFAFDPLPFGSAPRLELVAQAPDLVVRGPAELYQPDFKAGDPAEFSLTPRWLEERGVKVQMIGRDVTVALPFVAKPRRWLADLVTRLVQK